MEARGKTRREFLRCMALASSGVFARGAMGGVNRPDLGNEAMAFLRKEIPVMRRSQWCTIEPRPSRLRRARAYTRLTVHHSGNVNAIFTARGDIRRQIEGVLVGHMNRNYGDIGYHVVVDYAGGVWEGRSLAYEGAHVYAENDANVGVMLLGNFEQQAPSVAQLKAMRKTIYLLCRHFAIPSTRVYGHRDLGASVCPGQRLYAHVDVLRGVRYSQNGLANVG